MYYIYGHSLTIGGARNSITIDNFKFGDSRHETPQLNGTLAATCVLLYYKFNFIDVHYM